MSTYREEVAERLAPLLAVIAGANPAGADVSYDTEFESIKAEIDKLSSVDNLEPSWSRVEDLGGALLSQKGKDMRVVSWMAVAKVKTRSWEGFAEALVLFEGLARAFWDTMFPEARRARARLNAFAWMADMVNQHLVAKEVTLADEDAIRTCEVVLKDLDGLFAEKLGDAYSGPGQLRSLLRDKVREIPEPAPEPPAPSASQAQPQTQAAAPAPPPPVAKATSVDDVENAIRANGRSLVEAAAILRAADPARAWAYRLQRWASWINIEDAPRTENGKTFVPAPDLGTRRSVAELWDGQKWLELLNAAEEMTSVYVLWLDLHRYVAVAMDHSGPQFAAAREVVGREVVNLANRLPGIDSLFFRDKTPFADAATKAWLEEEGRKYGAAAGTSATATAISAEDDEIAGRLENAKKMVADGKVADGLAVAMALAARSADARMRFRSRLNVGKMALEGSKAELARPILEHLLADVERHDLEAWEPALCATLYAHLLTATREVSRARGGSPELLAREQHLYDKLCRLDPASAIKLST